MSHERICFLRSRYINFLIIIIPKRFRVRGYLFIEKMDVVHQKGTVILSDFNITKLVNFSTHALIALQILCKLNLKYVQ